jgi:hypothetical protein
MGCQTYIIVIRIRQQRDQSVLNYLFHAFGYAVIMPASFGKTVRAPEPHAAVGLVEQPRGFHFAAPNPTSGPWINLSPAPPAAARSAASPRCSDSARSARSAAPTSICIAGFPVATRSRWSRRIRAHAVTARTTRRSPHERSDMRGCPGYRRAVRGSSGLQRSLDLASHCPYNRARFALRPATSPRARRPGSSVGRARD